MEIPLPDSGNASFVPPDESRPRLRLVSGAGEPDLAERLNAWTVAVALHHDREAFGHLFRHFAPRMKGWLWKTGSTADEAEEIVQDAFVNLWRKAAQFDPARSDVAAWLFTIARNLRVDRRRAIHDTWIALDDAEVAAIPDAACTHDEALSRLQHDDRVRSAIATLSEEQGQLLRLSFYEDMSHSRIALELKMPLGTVKTKLRRAAARLRLLLEECRP